MKEEYSRAKMSDKAFIEFLEEHIVTAARKSKENAQSMIKMSKKIKYLTKQNDIYRSSIKRLKQEKEEEIKEHKKNLSDERSASNEELQRLNRYIHSLSYTSPSGKSDGFKSTVCKDMIIRYLATLDTGDTYDHPCIKNLPIQGFWDFISQWDQRNFD